MVGGNVECATSRSVRRYEAEARPSAGRANKSPLSNPLCKYNLDGVETGFNHDCLVGPLPGDFRRWELGWSLGSSVWMGGRKHAMHCNFCYRCRCKRWLRRQLPIQYSLPAGSAASCVVHSPQSDERTNTLPTCPSLTSLRTQFRTSHSSSMSPF